MRKMQEQFSTMEEKISMLEKENDQFIDREAQMRRVNNELRDELDTLKNTSRLSCISMQEAPRSVKLQLPKFRGLKMIDQLNFYRFSRNLCKSENQWKNAQIQYRKTLNEFLHQSRIRSL